MKKCEHCEQCSAYKLTAPSCNEEFYKGYCGIERTWDYYHDRKHKLEEKNEH